MRLSALCACLYVRRLAKSGVRHHA
jgi:hypothetical protein